MDMVMGDKDNPPILRREVGRPKKKIVKIASKTAKITKTYMETFGYGLDS